MSDVETDLDDLLDELERVTGVDHRIFEREPLRARIDQHRRAERLASLAELRARLEDPGLLERLLVAISRRPSTTLFDDPRWWRTLRERVMPLLRTYPSINVWLPRCATGEWAFALAIVLREEGLFERARIYATELHDQVLARARLGLLATEGLEGIAARYREAGGRATFAEYHTVDREAAPGGRARLRPLLLERISFLQHNVATDASFNEFHVIVGCHVATELVPSVARRASRLFHESLCRFGVLAIGPQDRASLIDSRGEYQCFEQEPFLLRKEPAKGQPA